MSWEPEYDVFDLSVDGGKYRFVSRRTGAGGTPPYATRAKEAYRNGEHWTVGVNWLLTEKHSKAFTAIMMELNTARRALRIIRDRGALMNLPQTELDAAIMARAFAEAGDE